MNRQIPAFIITIEHLKESVDSANKCIESAKKHNILHCFSNNRIEKHRAYTPTNCSIHGEYRKEELPIDPFLTTKKMSSRPLNVAACFLSMYSLWKKCIELNDTILILEHDARFNGWFENGLVPEFKGVLSVGAPSYGRFNTPAKKNIVIPLMSKKYLPGAHGYLVNPWGAARLIEQAKIAPFAADVFMHKQTFPWIQEYYPWLVKVEDNFTTIQSNSFGCEAKPNFKKNPSGYKIIEGV